MKRLFALFLIVCSLVSGFMQASSFADSTPGVAYILEPPTVPEEPKLKHEFMNILLLGVDYGIKTGGIGKSDIHNCHTDTIIFVAMDLTDKKISLISFPRDTLTYVPGVLGLYKLNAAFNCSQNVQEGLKKTCETIAYWMGGIQPDHYVLITPELVRQIGDAIDGLDINVLTDFEGYQDFKHGLQHLDGAGIMSYARTRKKAKIDPTDYGRTQRQRQILTAMFEKVSGHLDYVYDILDVIVDNYDEQFFSDMSVFDLWDLLPLADQLAEGSIKSYVMDGTLDMAMKHYRLNFVDQKKRRETIRTIFGVDVPKTLLTTRRYGNYLYKKGFEIVKAIRVCDRVTAWAVDAAYTGEALSAAQTLRDETVKTFSAIDDLVNTTASSRAEKKKSALIKAVKELAAACNYPDELDFGIARGDWFNYDPDINEYYEYDWT